MPTSVMLIAPRGDLVIAVGKDGTRKTVKVSSALLCIASPVFEAMLGPSFKEGQTKHGASNPLELPDDDPATMLNLCNILHYRARDANIDSWYYLQKLAFLCDKYQYGPSLRDFFDTKIRTRSLNAIDQMIIYKVTDDKENFEACSETVVRMTWEMAVRECHTDLLQLLPDLFLSKQSNEDNVRLLTRDSAAKLKLHRERVRTEYLNAAQMPTTSMFTFTKGLLCLGLSKRLAVFQKALYDKKIISKDVREDAKLPDTHKVLLSSQEVLNIDNYRCQQK